MIDLDELERLYKEGAAQGDFLDWYKAIKPVAPQLIAIARRYQWLRRRVPGSTYRIMGVIYSEGGQGVDAAIDAAMQEQEQER